LNGRNWRRTLEAERLYRVLMNCDPTNAAPPFNLANLFRATGRKIEAEAALRAATRADPFFAEALYNLSDLLDEQGRRQKPQSIVCAVRSEPRRTMPTRCSILRCCNKHAEAAEYWRHYLAKDGKSEWAARARRSLKFCEMQMHLSAS
jgi:tetratricopeptide (TPR) repeat protein